MDTGSADTSSDGVWGLLPEVAVMNSKPSLMSGRVKGKIRGVNLLELRELIFKNDIAKWRSSYIYTPGMSPASC